VGDLSAGRFTGAPAPGSLTTLAMSRSHDLSQPHVAAHEHSSGHRESISASALCGCFYCCSVFAPTAVKEWVDSEQTALCPECGIDSVIGSAAGYPVTRAFLERMRAYWF
jgi:hypothetical protein